MPARLARSLAVPLLLLAAVPLCGQMGGEMGGGRGGGGGGWGRGGAMGQRRMQRVVKPITRAHFDRIVTALFREGDADHDGTITLAELGKVIESRREALIRQRFAAIDQNHDGNVTLGEFDAWQRGMGSVALDDAAASGAGGAIVPETITPRLEGEDRALAGLIEPLNATLLARANTNYDAGVSLAELLAAEAARFEAADTDHDGALSIDEIRKARGQRPRGWGSARPGGGFGRGGAVSEAPGEGGGADRDDEGNSPPDCPSGTAC